jgi:hypothetical protein
MKSEPNVVKYSCRRAKREKKRFGLHILKNTVLINRLMHP